MIEDDFYSEKEDAINMTNKIFKRLCACLILATMMFGLTAEFISAGSVAQAAVDGSTTGQTDADDLSKLVGKTFAICEGTSFEDTLKEEIPGEYKLLQFKTTTDAAEAVVSGKADIAVMDYPVAKLAAGNHKELGVYSKKLEPYENGWAFRKGDKRRDEFSAVLEKFDKDGTLKRLMDKWTSGNASDKTIPEQSWPGSKGEIVFTSSPDYEPVYYMGEGGQILGYDVELMLLACKELDYHVKFVGLNFDGMMPALASGKTDLLGGGLAIKEERKKTMDFTYPEYQGATTLVVRKDGPLGDGISDANIKDDKNAEINNEGFFESLKNSFYNTYIVESRWKMILQGLGVTIVISVASAIIGLIFGFCLCMIRRSKVKVASKLVAIFVRIIQGTPIIVILMILYYIIFGSTDVSGVVIAVIGFSINFAAYSSEMMRSGINAVSDGQREAALALGLTNRQSFFMVVFPQAATHFIPVLKGEFISMVKMTSVVGYIAVEDLTKISDIIRSRTMDAFFPLISTAVIYFILANVLILAISFFEKKVDAKKRPRVVKMK